MYSPPCIPFTPGAALLESLWNPPLFPSPVRVTLEVELLGQPSAYVISKHA